MKEGVTDATRDPDLDAVVDELGRLFDAGQKEVLLGAVRSVLGAAKTENQLLTQKVVELTKKVYGRSSEKIDPNQLRLALAEMREEASEPSDVDLERELPCEPPEPAAARKKTSHRGRRPLPAELPREEIRIAPELAADKVMTKVGEERSEVLEYEPARFKVLVYIRETWSNAAGEIVTAPAPNKIIDKGLPGPRLLTQVVLSKFKDHNPLSRQVKIYLRAGVELHRNTLVDWIAAVAFMLEPIANRIYELAMLSHALQVDDTRLDVLDRNKKRNIKRAHLWVLVGDSKYIAVKYTPDWTAEKAEAYLRSSGIGDVVYFGPEAEFFLFDDVRFSTAMNKVGYQVDAIDGAWNTDTDYEMGNMGHRPGVKGGYFPVNPVDEGADIRSEMLSTMKRIGMKVDKHHHEVASCQHELGLIFSSLTDQGDQLQKYKYIIQNVAHAYGKSATFMPKPIAGDNGTGMHCNMSIWKDGKPLFAGDKYADLSDEALYYIGGILRHAKALNAFTNPTTNSYKRLIPGFEAPVLRAYSARNRSASVRIPWTESPKAKRVEVRFPDPTANPYLAFSALLMAGLDGINNKIDPGQAMDKDLYDLPPRELKRIPTVCASLREALAALDKDRTFLKAGGVFDDDQIDAYIELKMEEVIRFEHTPHPVEYLMYYSV